MRALFSYILGLFLGSVFSWAITYVFLRENKPEPPTTYECPCEVEQIVTDVISHTNKDDMTTVTTYIDVSKCVGVVGN